MKVLIVDDFQKKYVSHGYYVYYTLKKYLHKKINIECMNIFEKADISGEGIIAAFSKINRIKEGIVLLCFECVIESFQKIMNQFFEEIQVNSVMYIGTLSNRYNDLDVWSGATIQVISNKSTALYEENYKKRENLILEDASPEFVYFPPENTWHLFSGTSKAAPKICADIINNHISIQEINKKQMQKYFF